jgi:pyruvate/2-oxoglutarate dehydrogenase complex dihydrolipoamide acyltransferase (E2) component
MFLNRTAPRILLAFAVLFVGCKQMPPSATPQQVAAQAVPASPSAQSAAPQHGTSLSNTPQAGQAGRAPAQEPKVEDVEERRGPFTIGGQTFAVVLRWKRLQGQMGDFGKAPLHATDVKKFPSIGVPACTCFSSAEM